MSGYRRRRPCIPCEPYVVAASDGRYFLLGNIDGKDEITPFAVELLDSVSLLEEEARPQKTIPGAEMGIRVSDSFCLKPYIMQARRKSAALRRIGNL